MLAVDSNGKTWSWGDVSKIGDDIGANDDNGIQYRNVPGLVAANERVTSVAAGEDHSIVLTTDGKVIAWGENAYGELGDGTLNSHDFYKRLPVRVKMLANTRFTQVDVGSWLSIALDTDGKVWYWGSNYYGINCSEPEKFALAPRKIMQPYYKTTGVTFDGASVRKISEDSNTQAWTVEVPKHGVGTAEVKVSAQLNGRTTDGISVPGISEVNVFFNYQFKDSYTVEFDLGKAPGTPPAKQVVIQQTPIKWPEGPNPRYNQHWFNG